MNNGVSRPLLLGHRGARRYKPENTLAAFDLALEHGCDGFEFDVRLTSDNRPVICHDPDHYGLPVAATPHSHPAMQDLIDLDSVLALYSTVFLDIELKVRESAPFLAAALESHVPEFGCVGSSFLPETLRDLHSIAPQIPLGLIAEEPGSLQIWRELPLNYLIPEESLVHPGLVREVRGAGLKLLTWTVNAPGRMRELLEMGVDGLISDDTMLLHQVAESVFATP